MIANRYLIGRVGGDAETKFLQNGTQVTNFNVAEDRSYSKKKGEEWEKVEVTQWYRVSIFGGRAAWAVNIKKGYLFIGIGVETPNAYINDHGEPVGNLNFKCDEFQFYKTVKISFDEKEDSEDIEF